MTPFGARLRGGGGAFVSGQRSAFLLAKHPRALLRYTMTGA